MKGNKEEEEIEMIEPASNIWLPVKEDEQVQGRIIRVTEGQFGSMYVLELDDKTEQTLPSHRYLMPRLAMCQVGDYIKVTYTGEQPPKLRGQNPMKTYTVARIKNK